MTSHERLGSELAGYRIESVIGRGGMSVVYLAEETHLERRVALKLLAPELAEDAKFRERFIRESRLAASLEHPNIITVYEAREVEGQLYIAMRYISGGDLKGLIGREGPLDAERTISILTQAASALDAAHAEGLIHRDVKPGNILLNPRSESMGSDRVYLSDFGLTKRATSDSGITATGQFVGSLDYAAPEQFQGKTLDASTDVYSLGCVLYECLTGEVPYPQENQAALVYAHLMAAPPKVTAKRTDLPPQIDDVVAKALAKTPGDRYRTAGELAEAARAALGVDSAAPALTRPMQAGSPPPRGPSRNRLLVIGGGVLAAVALIVGLAVANRGGASSGPPNGGAVPVDYVARVDPSSRRVVARIPIGKKPIGMAVGEGSVWVLDDDGSVWRIDPVTNKATVIKAVADDPRAISAGEGAVWVADNIGRAVHKIDPASNRVVSSFRAADGAVEVAAGQGAAWVVGRGGIVRYDPASGQSENLGGPIQFDSSGYLGLGTSDVWYADDFGRVVKLDPKTNKFTQHQLEKAAADLAVGGDSVWVAACGTPATIFRIDARTGDIAAQVAAGGAVCRYAGVTGNRMSIAVGSDGAWVIDAPNGTVSRIGLATNQVDAPIHVGATPTAVAVGLGSVWVTVDGR